jgi:site-specific recombinase XerD
MESDSAIAGAASLVLADNVIPLDPKPAMFEAMLEGWERQQSARFLKEATIAARLRFVRRFAQFTNQYPWEWTAGEAEAFFDDLRRQEKPVASSTVRGYQVVLRLFLDFAADERYGWGVECERRFGAAPVQVLHEWNTVAHRLDYEGQPARRPLSYDEVQALFDAADGLVEMSRRLGRKGGLTAQRDAALLKCVYAFGLRRREAWGLDLSDLRRNPQAVRFGRFGALFVRFGKGSAGSAPKRRTVLLVPEMDWIIDVLTQWLGEVRPLLSPGAHPALFVTERRGRISLRGLDTAFARARAAAGLDERLDLHCLRHSHITHMIEFGYPEKFVQEQAGHAYASTTALYTGVGDEFRNRLILNALQQRHQDLWKEER